MFRTITPANIWKKLRKPAFLPKNRVIIRKLIYLGIYEETIKSESCQQIVKAIMNEYNLHIGNRVMRLPMVVQFDTYSKDIKMVVVLSLVFILACFLALSFVCRLPFYFLENYITDFPCPVLRFSYTNNSISSTPVFTLMESFINISAISSLLTHKSHLLNKCL